MCSFDALVWYLTSVDVLVVLDLCNLNLPCRVDVDSVVKKKSDSSVDHTVPAVDPGVGTRLLKNIHCPELLLLSLKHDGNVNEHNDDDDELLLSKTSMML